MLEAGLLPQDACAASYEFMLQSQREDSLVASTVSGSLRHLAHLQHWAHVEVASGAAEKPPRAPGVGAGRLG